MGHNIASVGFTEALNLVISPKIGEKLAGYTYASIVMLGNADISERLIDAIKNDISACELPSVKGDNIMLITSLALNCLSTVAGPNMLKQLQPAVVKFILVSEIFIIYLLLIVLLVYFIAHIDVLTPLHALTGCQGEYVTFTEKESHVVHVAFFSFITRRFSSCAVECASFTLAGAIA